MTNKASYSLTVTKDSVLSETPIHTPPGLRRCVSAPILTVVKKDRQRKVRIRSYATSYADKLKDSIKSKGNNGPQEEEENRKAREHLSAASLLAYTV